MIEPFDNLKVMSPRVVRISGQEPALCLVNPSDKYRLIKKGLHIAEAYQIGSILEEKSNNDLDPSIFEVIKDTAEVNVSQSDSEGVLEEQKCLLPEHLEQVFKASTKQLSSTESLQLAHLQVLKMSLQGLNLTLATFLESSMPLTRVMLDLLNYVCNVHHLV